MTDIKTRTVQEEVVLFLYERQHLRTSDNTPINTPRIIVQPDLAVLEGLFTDFKTFLKVKEITTRDEWRQLENKDDFNLLLDPAWKGPKSVDVHNKFKIQDETNEFNGQKAGWEDICQSSSVQELWENIRVRKRKKVTASQDKDDKEKKQNLSEGVMTSSQGKETDAELSEFLI